MRVLVAMSGGVDSSVAAALLKQSGHDVVGATMKLWGGVGDSGCCSVADVTDARRVADHLGIAHHVFNFTDAFNEFVVEPYVAAHRDGRTPNPCVECNRYLKFDAFLSRAGRLGFDAIATGHHARVLTDAATGRATLWRGADPGKDQSYVLSVLDSDQLGRVLLPIGGLRKTEVRALAGSIGLRTADKPDSQDVCFIASRTKGAGRRGFLADRMELHPATVIDTATGAALGTVPAGELVTIGQRRGLALSVGPEPRYVVDVDLERHVILLGSEDDLLTDSVVLAQRTWVDGPLPVGSEVFAQASAHGEPRRSRLTATGVAFSSPTRRVAPGQVVACYVGDRVVGSGIAA